MIINRGGFSWRASPCIFQGCMIGNHRWPVCVRYPDSQINLSTLSIYLFYLTAEIFQLSTILVISHIIELLAVIWRYLDEAPIDISRANSKIVYTQMYTQTSVYIAIPINSGG